MGMTRRTALKLAGTSLCGLAHAPLWLQRAAAGSAPKKTLVSIFLRGAADGLNIVVPHAEKRYYELRPTIAVPRASVIDLDEFFGFHPLLAPLKPLYDARQLAVVHAVGSPDPTRSHFDAQDYMESGTPGRKSTRDGWLNRALPAVERTSPVRAVSLTGNVAKSMRGRQPALAVASLQDFRVRDDQSLNDFKAMYAGSPDERLRGSAADAFQAERLLASIRKTPAVPSNGAQYPQGKLGRSLADIARLIKADCGLEVACADMGGWDHHFNEAGANPETGALASQLRELGGALAAFQRDLGERMDDVVVVTMSEFGRTAKENGSRGTDHGHANFMFVLGGPVRGGRVYGRWPGLDQSQLYEERDLEVTTDFREVLVRVVSTHLKHPDPVSVFPAFQPNPKLSLGFLG